MNKGNRRKQKDKEKDDESVEKGNKREDLELVHC